MITAFIDESGDLGFSRKSSAHFVIAVVLTKEPELLRRSVRKVRDTIRTKRRPSEIHWSSSDETVRRRIIEAIAKVPFEAHILVLDKQTVYEYLHDRKDKLYHYLSGILLGEARFDEREITIIFDNRAKKRVIRDDLSTYILKKLFERDYRVRPKVEHVRSTDDRGLQAADAIAGAAFAKYEHKDGKYLDRLRERIASEKTFFTKGKWM